MDNQLRKYQYNIEFMRAIAILLVVFTHIPMQNFYIDMSENTFSLQRFFYTLFQNGTVVFIFISGYLFYHLNQKLDFKKYIFKKAKYVITPYVIIISCCLSYKYLTHSPGIPLFLLDSGYINSFFLSYIYGGWVLGPLWFIPMIIIFFITSPIIKASVDSKYCFYFLAISLTVSFLTLRPWGNYNPLLSFIHFLGIYMLGCTLAKRNKENKSYSNNFIILLLVSLFFGAFPFTCWSMNYN